MKKNTLSRVIASIRENWKGLETSTVVKVREQLLELLSAPTSEPWLADLYSKKEDSVELYRDPEHGFILLAHFESKGLYRMPHNHGIGWVFYALHQGQMEMSTFGQVTNQSGHTYLVSRGAFKVNAGDCHVYLPGDIHDTNCLSESVLMFRLTSCDFKVERSAGRLIQFKD